jgi:hypothetical protein
MMIILESLGGEKVRISTNRIIKYRQWTSAAPSEEDSLSITATELTIDSSDVLYVKESPEVLDEILRVNCVTVYERK